jgi:hypothetical protein
LFGYVRYHREIIGIGRGIPYTVTTRLFVSVKYRF